MPTVANDTVAEDARWLRQAGVPQSVSAGDEVIRAGEPPEYLFVVLEGEFEVEPTPGRRARPGRLGAGALLWRLAYLRRLAPRRSIRAVTDGVLLCIRPGDVDRRMRQDPSFRTRLMRLLSSFAREHAAATPYPEASGGQTGNDVVLEAHHVPSVIEKMLRGDFS